MEPSGRTIDVSVPMLVVGKPSIWPLSSNDTSAVGGSMEITRLTTHLPFVSPICGSIMINILFFLRL
jgi:hypothetical protein